MKPNVDRMCLVREVSAAISTRLDILRPKEIK